MTLTRYGLLAAILLLPCIARAAIAPRSVVSIDREQVTLGDLFSGLGTRGSRVIGPAPAPGARIDVGSRQLAAIAHQFGVGWKPPAQPDGTEVVIIRSGQRLTLKAVAAALRPSLVAAGAPLDAAVTVAPAGLPMVPPHTRPHLVPLHVSYDATSGQFSAALLVSAPSMRSTQAQISGFAQPSRLAVVAVHALSPGEVITREDVRLRRMPLRNLPDQAPHQVADVVGLEAERAVAAGAPLDGKHLSRPQLIARGATVELDLSMPGLDVSAQGVALGSGAAGAVVPVLNPSSHLVVQAVVDGPDRAHVVPGSRPERRSAAAAVGSGGYYARYHAGSGDMR